MFPHETFEECNDKIIKQERKDKENKFIDTMSDFNKFENHPIAKACFSRYGGVLTSDIKQAVMRIASTAINMYREEYQYG